jgi:hypothetical protein
MSKSQEKSPSPHSSTSPRRRIASRGINAKDLASSCPLSLHPDSPASASYFPSPSSFLPPPMPGAHEFAIKPPPRCKSANANSISLNVNNSTLHRHHLSPQYRIRRNES